MKDLINRLLKADPETYARYESWYVTLTEEISLSREDDDFVVGMILQAVLQDAIRARGWECHQETTEDGGAGVFIGKPTGKQSVQFGETCYADNPAKTLLKAYLAARGGGGRKMTAIDDVNAEAKVSAGICIICGKEIPLHGAHVCLGSADRLAAIRESPMGTQRQIPHEVTAKHFWFSQKYNECLKYRIWQDMDGSVSEMPPRRNYALIEGRVIEYSFMTQTVDNRIVDFDDIVYLGQGKYHHTGEVRR